MPKDRIYISPYHHACAIAISEARRKVTHAVKKAVKAGALRPVRELTCVDCGSPAFDYDHRRYMAPLDVEPTCRSCNLKRGPALDVIELVMSHFNPGVSIAEFMAKRREDLAQRRHAILSQTTPREP